jgi:hypothetical protein
VSSAAVPPGQEVEFEFFVARVPIDLLVINQTAWRRV